MYGIGFSTYVRTRWENMPPTAGLGNMCQVDPLCKTVQKEHAHPERPFLQELSLVSYLSGNTAPLTFEFAWLWILWIKASRTVVSDTNADVNNVHAE